MSRNKPERLIAIFDKLRKRMHDCEWPSRPLRRMQTLKRIEKVLIEYCKCRKDVPQRRFVKV